MTTTAKREGVEPGDDASSTQPTVAFIGAGLTSATVYIVPTSQGVNDGYSSSGAFTYETLDDKPLGEAAE